MEHTQIHERIISKSVFSQTTQNNLLPDHSDFGYLEDLKDRYDLAKFGLYFHLALELLIY